MKSKSESQLAKQGFTGKSKTSARKGFADKHTPRSVRRTAIIGGIGLIVLAAAAIFLARYFTGSFTFLSTTTLPPPHVPAYPMPSPIELSDPYPPSPVPSQDELDSIENSANAGDAKAQLYLGHFYANGDRVAQNFTEAAKWYRKAAEQGNARAQQYLGMLYECGVGVERDYAESFAWYMKSVEQNDPIAHMGIAGFHFAFRKKYMPLYLGDYDIWRVKAAYLSGAPNPKSASLEESLWRNYHSGTRFYQNNSAIAAIIRDRALAGDGEATLLLAKMVLHAQGASRNHERASDLVFAAAGQGNKAAMFLLGSSVALKIPRRTLVVPESRDERWSLLAMASQSVDEPYFVFAYHYLVMQSNRDFELWKKGRGRPDGPTVAPTASDLTTHMNGLRALADQGYVRAQYELAREIISRGGDISEASRLLERAAESGHLKAKAIYGLMVMFGTAVPQNIERGKKILDEAMYSDDYSAIDILGTYMQEIIEVTDHDNVRTTAVWLRDSHRNGNGISAVYLGYLAAVQPAIGDNPLELFISAYNDSIPSAEYVLYKYATEKKIDMSGRIPELIDIKDAMAEKTKPIFLHGIRDPKLGLTALCIPAALKGNGPSILCVLDELTLTPESQDPKFLSEFWLDKFFKNKNWYKVNRPSAYLDSIFDFLYPIVYENRYSFKIDFNSTFFFIVTID